jgi:hypothetical protein
MYGLWRVQVLGTFAACAVVGVTTLVVSLSFSFGPPAWFAALWLLAVIWNAYWFLLRIAYRLDLSEADLSWRTPLRSGTIALADLVEMRPSRMGSTVEVLSLSDGSKVLVMVRKGFVDFATEIQQIAPHLQVRIGLYAKIGERLPGPRGFRPSD